MSLDLNGKPESISLLGVRVHSVTMDETIALIDRFVQARGPHHIVTLDASMCVMTQNDAELRSIVNAAELVTPDSTGVLWACRRMGNPLNERVSGVEIIERLCAASSKNQQSLFFFGAAPGVAASAAEKMREKYSGVRIVGYRDGYFTPDDEVDIAKEIRDAQPDILCVALGIPKQEKWISRHRGDLGVPVMIGVGGTLDVLSGQVKRAPVLIQKMNLEWLYRLAKNPRKFGKVLTLPRFVLMALRSPRKSIPK